MFLLLSTFYLCRLAAHRRCTPRVYIAENRAPASTGVGNAHPSMQRRILICPHPARPLAPPSEHLQRYPDNLPPISRGQEDYFMNMHRALLIHIHARVIHNGPLPLPTSDVSALISSLFSRLARASLRGVEESFKWLVDTMTETRLPRDRCNVVFGVTSLMNSDRTRNEDGSRAGRADVCGYNATSVHKARYNTTVILLDLLIDSRFVTPSFGLHVLRQEITFIGRYHFFRDERDRVRKYVSYGSINELVRVFLRVHYTPSPLEKLILYVL